VIRLEDVADVVLGAESYDQDVRFSGKPEVFMGVWVLPNQNTLDVIGRVRHVMGQIEQELPRGLRAKIAFDSTSYIESSVNEVTTTLLETVAIVVLVIFLFLGSLRTAAVPLVAIPVSLIGAVFLIQAFGFTLNLLTLLAIVLAVGLVVDDAIVVVENVERNTRLGLSPLEAALQGARELIGPVIAMTLTLAAVYIPVGFQGGLTGALFREFAFTLAGAVFISGIVALTLSPVMSSRLIKTEEHRSKFGDLVDSAFNAVRWRYAKVLRGTLGKRGAVYLVWVLLSLAAIPMYMFSPKELAPNEDQGVVFGALDVPPNATLEQLVPYTGQVAELLASVPEFGQSFQITFPTGGFGGALMKPWKERNRDIFQIQAELSEKTSVVAGIRAPVFLPPPLPSAGFFPVEVVVASTKRSCRLRNS
jgi:multidrug efflux pump